MFKKLRILFLSLIILIATGSSVFATAGFEWSTGTGTGPDVYKSYTLVNYNGGNSTTLQTAINSSTWNCGIYNSSASATSNTGPAINQSSGTSWLILSAGDASDGVNALLLNAKQESSGYSGITLSGTAVLNIVFIGGSNSNGYVFLTGPSSNGLFSLSDRAQVNIYTAAQSSDSASTANNLYSRLGYYGGANPLVSLGSTNNSFNIYSGIYDLNTTNKISSNQSMFSGNGSVGFYNPRTDLAGVQNPATDTGGTLTAFGGTPGPRVTLGEGAVLNCINNTNNNDYPYNGMGIGSPSSVSLGDNSLLAGSDVNPKPSYVSGNNYALADIDSWQMTGSAFDYNGTCTVTGDFESPNGTYNFSNSNNGNALVVPSGSSLIVGSGNSVNVTSGNTQLDGTVETQGTGEFSSTNTTGKGTIDNTGNFSGTVYSIGLDATPTTFYTSSSDITSSNYFQGVNIGYDPYTSSIVGTKPTGTTGTNGATVKQVLYPWFVNWTITGVTSSGNFGTPYPDGDDLTGGTDTWTVTATNSWLDNQVQEIYVNGTKMKGYLVPATVSSATNGIYLFSPVDTNNNATTEVYLLYQGDSTYNLKDGVYRLTATYNQLQDAINSAQSNKTVSNAISFVVTSSQVSNVQITNIANQEINGPITVDLSNGRTYQLHYIAKNGDGDVVQGTNPIWSLSEDTILNNNTSDYAVINQETGEITFLQPLPTNDLLMANLTLDGVNASNNPVMIGTTGSLPTQDVTGIAPIKNPVYVQSGSNQFNLDGNVVFTPLKSPVSASNLTFDTSNPNVIIFNSGTSQDPNYIAIAPSGTFTGSTTITATYTGDNNQTYTTTFDINFVTSTVNASGVTAAESLTFALSNPTPQNVDAALTPVTTTTNIELNTFNYSSSNTNIATVDSFGNVTPIGVGTCTITTTVPTGTNGFTGNNRTATTTITVNEAPETATAITLDPSSVFLAPEETENGTTSAEITATVTPENVDPSSVTWTVEPAEGVTLSETTGLTTTVSATDTTGTYTVTASVPGADDTTLTATTEVNVTDSQYVMDPTKSSIVAGGGSPGATPDYFTVNAAVMANPAIEGADTSAVTGVTIFAWSQDNQSDMNAKAVTTQSNGVYSQLFPVNNTPVNNYFLDASAIKINVYASTSADANDEMVWAPSWDYCTSSDWTQDVLVTTYSQNNGFNLPSVGENEVSGTTGQVLGMEGIRLSTPLEGVDINYSVYVKEDGGWQEEVGEGEYAGTMWQNKQIQGININLTGDNAAQYDVQYQVHVSNIGWMDWVNEGTNAGDPNNDLQIEAIAVQIVPAGTALPSNQR